MFLKLLALRLLPDGVLGRLKRWHYARVLRRLTPAGEPELAIIQDLVRPGDVVLDVGANIGTFTKFLSQLVGPAGRVIAVEPVPLTATILRSNLRALGLRNVSVYEGAASDVGGRVRMEVPHYSGGGENYYRAGISVDLRGLAWRSIEVLAVRLESLLEADHSRVAFVKCDVEGHELQCARGAGLLVRPRGPAWLVEVARDPDDAATDAAQLFRMFEIAGYSPFLQTGPGVRRRVPGDRAVNYFFLTGDHIQMLRAKGRPVG